MNYSDPPLPCTSSWNPFLKMINITWVTTEKDDVCAYQIIKKKTNTITLLNSPHEVLMVSRNSAYFQDVRSCFFFSFDWVKALWTRSQTLESEGNNNVKPNIKEHSKTTSKHSKIQFAKVWFVIHKQKKSTFNDKRSRHICFHVALLVSYINFYL